MVSGPQPSVQTISFHLQIMQMPEFPPRLRQGYIPWLLPWTFLSLLASQCVATVISTFQDTDCQKSINPIDGPNGYPDGLCTSFTSKASGHFSSFQVVGKDRGCTGRCQPRKRSQATVSEDSTNEARKNNQVTIYGSNSDTAECSSDTLEFAEVGRCYNTSWEYYSIDACIKPESLPSSTDLALSTSTGSSNENLPAGTIAGAVVGAVAGLGVLLGALVYVYCFRRRRNRHLDQAGQPTELSSTDKMEMPTEKDNVQRFELSHRALPSELGLHEPAETEGDVRYPAEVGTS